MSEPGSNGRTEGLTCRACARRLSAAAPTAVHPSPAPASCTGGFFSGDTTRKAGTRKDLAAATQHAACTGSEPWALLTEDLEPNLLGVWRAQPVRALMMCRRGGNTAAAPAALPRKHCCTHRALLWMLAAALVPPQQAPPTHRPAAPPTQHTSPSVMARPSPSCPAHIPNWWPP